MANYLLGIYHNGECRNPDELPNETAPCYYDSPSAAKAAGRTVLGRHPEAEGFTVRRIVAGHFRTVAVGGRSA